MVGRVSIGNMNFAKGADGKNSVVVYSTSTCPYCTMAKDYLKKLGVGFEDKRVDMDAHALEEMLEKSGQQGVPVLDVRGRIIVGFDRPAIDAALRM